MELAKLYFLGICIALASSEHPICNNQLRIELTNNEEIYTMNTCILHDPNSRTLPYLTSCKLLKEFKKTLRRVRTMSTHVTEMMTTNSEQCHVISPEVETINNANNLNELLVLSLKSVSSTLLNMTIINCHAQTILREDVYSESLILVKLIRKLLYRVDYDDAICHSSISLPRSSRLNQHNLLAFTCKNLSSAKSLFQAIELKFIELSNVEISLL